jgi:hypothetical protein
MLSDGRNHNNKLHVKSAKFLADAVGLSYLLPFSTSSQKSDQSWWNPQPLSDLGSVVDELVGAELENKQAPNEGGDVEADIVVVDHVEKSVIAWSSECEEKRGEIAWGEES